MVAKFPHERIHSSLSLRLLLSLLRYEASDKRRGEHVLVFRLHADHGVPVLHSHGFDRILCVLLVHQKDLQRRQSGLSCWLIGLNLI